MRKTILITGSCGLIGSEAARHFVRRHWQVIGLDNNSRASFFGPEASTRFQARSLRREKGYHHFSLDVRAFPKLERIFKQYGNRLEVILHTAAQPAHDWAADHPLTDFAINATGTLNLLELTRRFCPQAVFVFLSTNKVYGDTPNRLPFRVGKTRFDLPKNHPSYLGIRETQPVDQSLHSVFGCSKLAADVLVQEYGRNFGLKTTCLRAGCLTGPGHAAVEQHGFLAYLMKCCATGKPYTIYGYEGKQVRDNLHSQDVVAAIAAIIGRPNSGEVYNLGGGRQNSCSIKEAIALCESITGKKLITKYSSRSRAGDHVWYITNLKKFKTHYPRWHVTRNLAAILKEIYLVNHARWAKE